MSHVIRFRTRALVAALALLLAPSIAGAQCLISGGRSLCNGPVQLCGPEGNYEYMWIDPAGQFTFDRCISASTPGTYMLQVTDEFGNSFGPCSHTIEPASPAPCAITGPSTSCEGNPVELCGPIGDFRYSWSGPNGFVSASACVQASVSGVYRLSVWRLSDNCPETTCEHTVTFTSCDTTPPPPPPPLPTPTENCPRPAWFWMRQCLRGDDHARRVSPEDMSKMAALIDADAAIFSWTSPREGLCATLHPRPSTLRERAKRQFAAVHANVCAGEMSLPRVAGYLIKLDRSTPVNVLEMSTTVGDWLTATDAQLQQLETRNRRANDVKKAYRQIIRSGWYINHGRGVGVVCGRRPMDRDDDDRVLSGDSRGFEESLESELADDDDAGVELARGTPNPFSASTTITFVVSGNGAQDVRLAVYDLAGRMVRELTRGQKDPGTHEVRWDGRGADGAPVRSGVYFLRGAVGAQSIRGQLTFLK